MDYVKWKWAACTPNVATSFLKTNTLIVMHSAHSAMYMHEQHVLYEIYNKYVILSAKILHPTIIIIKGFGIVLYIICVAIWLIQYLHGMPIFTWYANISSLADTFAHSCMLLIIPICSSCKDTAAVYTHQQNIQWQNRLLPLSTPPRKNTQLHSLVISYFRLPTIALCCEEVI